ncbi:hypothetical protein [Methylophaga sp. OBS4]|uniref:hypothetical protein n=1 Tax=Methylophaga sp. OBS4 TaxID=2991935 RepID=UPI0022534FFB|nr:hypothetical protein [Methylophaga sp. OBS4]MCX4187790.1 hypothetical protein [Methylophaga sp. OBS4]
MAASIEFRDFMLEKNQDQEGPFVIAMQNPYFRPFATHLMMGLLYTKSLRYGIRSNIELFADWVTVELKRNPHIAYYQLAVNAQQALADSKKACDIAKEAQAIYPLDKAINKALSKCNEQQ